MFRNLQGRPVAYAESRVRQGLQKGVKLLVVELSEGRKEHGLGWSMTDDWWEGGYPGWAPSSKPNDQ